MTLKNGFRLAAVFGDHMVLARDKPIRIFGEAEDGLLINAMLNGHRAKSVAREGRFLITLPPMAAGGPYTLNVSTEDATIALVDVYLGEVYLAGGQSNMEMPLREAQEGIALAASTNCPLLRYYQVAQHAWLDAAALTAERQSTWRVAIPGECADMSAVAFHFAIRLQAELGVAVGVVDCFWGGTSASCWMEEEVLRSTADGQALWDEITAQCSGKTAEQMAEDIAEHDRAMQAWSDRVAELTSTMSPVDLTRVYELAGTCPWNPPKYGHSPFRPAGLVHTMLKRVAPYGISGFLYYQGEEDARHAWRYEALLTSLIRHWRTLFWDAELPFLFVQLPMYRLGNEADDFSWPLLRDAQARVAQSCRNTAMAVLIDAGELNNIHPADKKTVGKRLYLQALCHVYGRDVAADSPRARDAYPEGQTMIVRLNARVTCSGEAALFEIAGDDGVFYPAAVKLEGAELQLTAPEVTAPLHARYAWVNYGVVNVFGENGLPLAPFWLRNGAAIG